MAPLIGPSASMSTPGFSPRWVAQLLTMVGYHVLLAYNAISFEIDLPEVGPEPVSPV